MYSSHAGNANTEHNIGVQKQYKLIHVYMAHTHGTHRTHRTYSHAETLAHMHILTLTQMETEIHAKYAHRHIPRCAHIDSHICTCTDALTHVFIRDTNAQMHIQLDILKYTCTCAGTSEGFP